MPKQTANLWQIFIGAAKPWLSRPGPPDFAHMSHRVHDFSQFRVLHEEDRTGTRSFLTADEACNAGHPLRKDRGRSRDRDSKVEA
jgi:hypothetical protein